MSHSGHAMGPFKMISLKAQLWSRLELFLNFCPFTYKSADTSGRHYATSKSALECTVPVHYILGRIVHYIRGLLLELPLKILWYMPSKFGPKEHFRATGLLKLYAHLFFVHSEGPVVCNTIR